MSSDYEQLAFPEVDQACRTVWWLSGIPKKTKRWLGRKAIDYELVRDENGVWPEIVSMPSSKISEIKDVNLRCALELADATQAVGPTMEDKYTSSSHFVEIVATDEGADSQLLSAVFSGKVEHGVDSFMENLYRAAPGRE